MLSGLTNIDEVRLTLRRGTTERRRRAVRFLTELSGPRALEALIEEVLLVPGQPEELRMKAADAMRRHGPAARKKLTALLESSSQSDRLGALRGLRALGPRARRSLPQLFEHLYWQDIRRRERAAVLSVIASTGTEAEEFLEELRPFLADAAGIVRREAVKAYGRAGKNTPRVFKDLEKFMLDRDSDLREGAVEALADYGEVALETAMMLLNHSRPGVRAAAAELLEKLGAPCKDVVRGLERLLFDHDMIVRAQAARALVGQGTEARRCVPALMQALAQMPFGFWELERALRQIGPVALDYFRKVLVEGDVERRLSTVRALDGMEDPGGESLGLLCLALFDEDEHNAGRALSALRKQHPAKVRANIPPEVEFIGQFLDLLFHRKRRTADRAMAVLRTNDSFEWETYLESLKADG